MSGSTSVGQQSRLRPAVVDAERNPTEVDYSYTYAMNNQQQQQQQALLTDYGRGRSGLLIGTDRLQSRQRSRFFPLRQADTVAYTQPQSQPSQSVPNSPLDATTTMSSPRYSSSSSSMVYSSMTANGYTFSESG